MRNSEEQPNYGAMFDALWPRVREVIAFFGGMGIMFFEVVADKGDRPWLYAAAIGMMGLPVARYLESTLGRFSNSGPQEEVRRRIEEHIEEKEKDEVQELRPPPPIRSGHAPRKSGEK